MSLRRMMLAGLKGGVYKNVALASNGSTVSNGGEPIAYGDGNIANIIQGYRQTVNTATSTFVGWDGSGDIIFTIDVKAIKKIEEIDFLHGTDNAFTQIASNTPNVGTANIGIPNTAIVSYSSDGVSYTTLSSSEYSVMYLFSKNVLATSFNARYFRIYIPASEVIISGVELWGTN